MKIRLTTAPLAAIALAISALSAVAAPIPEAAWARCAAMHDDAERLTCFDKLTAVRTAQPTERKDQKAELERVIHRCRSRMSSYGSVIVKACVDEDMGAYRALGSYPPEHSAMIERCRRRMSSYGWAIVKACADEDIAAERDLRRMGKQ